jgi:hypothetical protein
LDSLDADAEFEDDPDFQQGDLHPSGTSHDEWIPMGMRSKEDGIIPFSARPPELGLGEGIADTGAGGATQELLFTGRAECVPDCVQRLVSFVNSPITPFMSSFLQNYETAEERAGSLPPTQQVTTHDDPSADTTGSLPPSDFSMQEYSLVTNSEVDTQVIHDLMKGRIDSDRSSAKEILTTL